MDMNQQTSSATVGDTVESTTQKAKEAATEAQQKIGDQLRSSVDTGKVRAADTLDRFANALTQSGQQLRNDNLGGPSQYIDRTGEQLRKASEYLRNTNVDDMVRNAEDFARRQPAVFIGGAFALGLLAARFIKASQMPRYGDVPRDKALVPQPSAWAGDRERGVSGYREPGIDSSARELDTDPSYTRAFRREPL